MQYLRIHLFYILCLIVGSGFLLEFYSRWNMKKFSPKRARKRMHIHRLSRISARFVEVSAPKWLRTNQDKCSPKTKVAFLKAHKCASSTIQNILFRYGERYDLLFALPSSNNYFGDGTNYIQKAFIDAPFENRMGFDILAIHGKWNISYMRSILLPKSTTFVTIVRDPVDEFISLFDYFALGRKSKKTLENYIKTVGVNEGREIRFAGMNQMIWDFGLPPEQFENQTEIDKIIQEADKTFHLVMVTERMAESLVLLRHLLCADYDDVVTLKVNARKKDVSAAVPKLDNQTLSILKKKLSPDYKLYDHFARKFDQLVTSFGIDKMKDEISKLDHAQLKIKEECDFGLMGSKVGKVGEFKTNSKDERCRAMTIKELKYIEQLKEKQRHKITLRQN